MTLRPYQNEALASAREAWSRGVRSCMISMATGTGKTVIFAAEADRRVRLAQRTLVLAHRDELLAQAKDKIVGLNGKLRRMVDVVSAGSRDSNAPIVVGSVASMRMPGRLMRYRGEHFGLVVVDEAHHSVAQSYRTILDWFGGAHVLMVTATPERADGVALGEVCDEIVYNYDLRAAIQDGWLVDIRQYAIRTTTSLDGVATRGGDLAGKQLEQTVNTPERNRLIVESWIEHARRRKTIAFCCDVKHATDLAQAFADFGVRAEPVWGAMPKKDRAAALGRLRDGWTQVSCNCSLLTEGYDEPSVSCVLMARPTKSKSLYMQCVGRGTRPHPSSGKRDLLVLDYVDASVRHSLVSAPTLLGFSSDDLDGKSSRETRDELREQSTLALDQEAQASAYLALPLEYRLVEVDPWVAGPKSMFTLATYTPVGSAEHARSVTQRQAQVLSDRGFSLDKIHMLTRGEANHLISEIARVEGWGRAA